MGDISVKGTTKKGHIFFTLLHFHSKNPWFKVDFSFPKHPPQKCVVQPSWRPAFFRTGGASSWPVPIGKGRKLKALKSLEDKIAPNPNQNLFPACMSGCRDVEGALHDPTPQPFDSPQRPSALPFEPLLDDLGAPEDGLLAEGGLGKWGIPRSQGYSKGKTPLQPAIGW